MKHTDKKRRVTSVLHPKSLSLWPFFQKSHRYGTLSKRYFFPYGAFAIRKIRGQLVAQQENGVKNYVHGDHLGSVSTITNQAGYAIENTTYEPFGAVVSGGGKSRFDYEGKEYDSSTEQYDFHFRQYSPQRGQFLQPDTLIQNVYDPQTLNRYSFERNNPYKYTDEDGHFVVSNCYIMLLQGLILPYSMPLNLLTWLLER